MPAKSPIQPRQPDRHPALSQLILCTGGSCAGKAGAYNPKKDLLDAWKKDYLWRVCHISFSDCLGPCELARNALVLSAQGTTWLSDTDVDSTSGIREKRPNSLRAVQTRIFFHSLRSEKQN